MIVDLNVIDINYDFSEDYKKNIDPDKYNLILRNWHKLLWEKPLPYNETVFKLIKKDHGFIFNSDNGEIYLTSDSIIHTYSMHSSYSSIINEFTKEEINSFFRIACRIGGYILFPGYIIDKKQTINGARGFHPRIADRFDLTLECIRLFYNGDVDKKINPLGEVINRYNSFFQLFTDFKGYCDFFLLQDLTNEEYSKIEFFLPFKGFTTTPKPTSTNEYRIYMENSINFVNNRNQRILNYISGMI